MEEIKKCEFVVSEYDFNYETASNLECVNKRGCTIKDTIFITGTRDSWCITRYEHKFFMLGRKRFVKRIKTFDVSYREYIRNGKKKSMWFGDPKTIENNTLKMLFEMFNIDWAINFMDQGYEYTKTIKRKQILKKIIKGNITSFEGVYKELQRNVFKVQNKIPSWKIMKKWIAISPMFPDITIYDFCDYTKDPMIAINKIYDCRENNVGIIAVYSDVLRYAIREDDIIDFKWSRRRFDNYHIQQIARDKIGDLNLKSRDSIYSDEFKSFFKSDVFKVIDSEYESAVNALKFSNCSYRNYWPQCYDGIYILFIVDYKEEIAMLGCFISNGVLEYNQCLRKYNDYISDDLQNIVNAFVDEHKNLPQFRIIPSEQDFEHKDALPW